MSCRSSQALETTTASSENISEDVQMTNGTPVDATHATRLTLQILCIHYKLDLLILKTIKQPVEFLFHYACLNNRLRNTNIELSGQWIKRYMMMSKA
ncbi:unnamed protein product [Arabidopsis arenosa]|uniref:Uncharacterized protein n=2 Tax=Arabidopsis TaxID=3701 RepID=A0A8T1XTU3_ARASU|nr:hypothetical protein ISN44_As13g014980 [Arabidopsis suecica]CAE6236306.1 unnamed protein product [Arabidopsis arenosa]